MYEYKPQRTNSFALYFIAMLFAAAIASFVASAFLPIASWIPQTVGLLLMVPMIQLITRYMATRYLYRICPYEDGNVEAVMDGKIDGFINAYLKHITKN